MVLSCNKQQVFNTIPLGAPGTIVPPVQEEYKINVSDKLSIKLFYNPELNQEVVVRPDGRITLQLVNEVKVLGLTPAKVSEVLTENYAKYLAQPPEVSVIVNSFAGQKVFVGGEVARSGSKGTDRTHDCVGGDHLGRRFQGYRGPKPGDSRAQRRKR